MATLVIDATKNRNVINAGIKYVAQVGRYVLVGLQKLEFRFSHPEFHKREKTLMSNRNATRLDFKIYYHMPERRIDKSYVIKAMVNVEE